MNTIEFLPDFVKGEHYREYTPKEGGYRYRFIVIQDIELKFIHPLVPTGHKIEFKDAKGRVWMTITSHKIVVSKNYAWDGCTPKKWWGIWWGTPDFKDTIFASLIHDVLLQFQHTKHSPFNRYEIDQIFKYILKENDFILTGVYYMGVRIGSMTPDKKYNVKSELTYIPHD
jgi:hypothetical protein